MTTVNAHSVVHHGVLNFVDNGGSSGLNTQGLLNLEKQKSRNNNYLLPPSLGLFHMSV